MLNWFDYLIDTYLSYITGCTLSSCLFPYSRLQPSIDGFHSYENSCDLFNYLLRKRFCTRNCNIYPERPLDSGALSSSNFSNNGFGRSSANSSANTKFSAHGGQRLSQTHKMSWSCCLGVVPYVWMGLCCFYNLLTNFQGFELIQCTEHPFPSNQVSAIASSHHEREKASVSCTKCSVTSVLLPFVTRGDLETSPSARMSSWTKG